MKALVLEEYNKLVYKDFPDPEITDNEVLVKVEAVGICGSDVHGMDGSSGRRIPPLVMGHEAAGVITSTGRLVEGWKAGDRVTFDSTIYKLDDWYTLKGMYNLSDGRMVLGVSPQEYRRHGAFAEYVNIPQHILYRIPDEVTFTQASMVEPVAVAAHAVGLTPLGWNDSAVVVGCGMIGLFVVQVLRTRGCGRIIAIDLEDDKIALAKKLGADVGFNPKKDNIREAIEALTEGRGADVAYEINLERYRNGDLTSLDLGMYQNQLSESKMALTNAIINYKIELLNLKIQTLYDFEKQVPIIPEELTTYEDKNK